ncbi:MAG: hypothetical protein ACXAD7_27465, partial [Candidatus Kariarchaeaceae archaeon]
MGLTIVQNNSVHAEVQFSDDFDDGDLQGWDLWGWNWTTPNITEWEGSMVNDDGVLTSANPQSSMWSFACKETGIEYGTWSFDWLPSATNDQDFISFVDGEQSDWLNANETDTYAYGYFLWLNAVGSNSPGIDLQKHVGTNTNQNVGSFYASESLEGWHEIDVTRGTDGLFKIYFDNELVIENVDTEVPSDKTFPGEICFGIDGDSSFDNIRISDTVDIPSSGSSSGGYMFLLIGMISLGSGGLFLANYLKPNFN